jgi:hypothetical protein
MDFIKVDTKELHSVFGESESIYSIFDFELRNVFDSYTEAETEQMAAKILSTRRQT